MEGSVRQLLAVLACLALPGLAFAQSAFAGVVKDTSGGVLPGVLVEASSDTLIEKMKSSTTDETGSYRIVNLRPGTYAVTFTLTGFQVVKHQDIQLPADFTRTINVELKLGAVSEVLTVTSTAPVVDVSNAVKVTSLDRQAMDELPLGNNIWEMAQMIPSIDIYASFTSQASSVGGNYGATQVYMSVHGMTPAQNVVMVDGMTVSGLDLDGTAQAYFNSDMNAEISYQTSGISADRSGGGVTVNMIPREGGNRFSGNAKISHRPHDWIASNSTERLQDMGLMFVGTLDYLADETISQGGPILESTLWFFGSYHQFDTSDAIPNSRDDSGNQTQNDQRIQQGSIRLTWQASARHKVSGSYEKTNKIQSNSVSALDDPETAGVEWASPNYSVGNVKLTSTLTSRFLFEGGYSFNRQNRTLLAHEGINQERFSPEWFLNSSKQTNDSTAGNPRSASPYSGITKDWPARDNVQGSVSYVTGQHQIKAGVQWQWGRFHHATDTNADLSARFEMAVPDGFNYTYVTPVDVVARNTPVESQEQLNADIGAYAQDSWRLKRLTVNAGLRWEHVNSETSAFEAPEGRFVPRRSVPAVKNVPDWYDWAPRFSMVYDLFGDARTALKYSANRYNRSAAVSLAGGFNTLSACVLTCAFIPWTETGLSGEGSLIPDVPEGRRTFTYNTDGTITATDCVLGSPGCDIDLSVLSKNPLYGTPAAQSQYAGFPRTWNLEQSFEVQHALTRRLSLTGNFTRGGDRDLTKTVNLAIQEGDYLPYSIYNPIDGTPITVYGIKDAATRTRIGPDSLNPNRISYVEPERRRTYHQYGLEFRVRPYAGAQVFGGISLERLDETDCVTSVPGVFLNPNDRRFCDDDNLDAIDDNNPQQQATGGLDLGGRIPYSKDFRLGVTLPLPWYGINFGASYMNNDAGSYTVTYTITSGTGATSTRYPDGNPAGASSTRKVATQPAPPCPTTHGCVPGDFVLPATFLSVSGATSISVNLAPQGGSTANFGGQGRLRGERVNQLDLKFSKTFHIRNMSILPTAEVFNVFNGDKIFSYSSTSYAVTAGTYLVPSGILQSRIVAVGAQVRW